MSSLLRWVLFLVVCAAPISILAATDNVIISEFLASNNSGLKDDFNEYSDWIEIFNAGTNTVNLLDWGLTDSAGDHFKWRFPATNIAAGRFVIVFASNRDRRTPGAALHTNFRLDAGGEYLGLFRPDGSVATEFNSFGGGFPQQVPNVSYGLGALSTNITVVSSNSTVRWIVPNAATDTTWASTNFNDSAWILGTNGVGYGPTNATQADYGAAIAPTAPVGYWRLNESAGPVATNIGSGTGLNGTYTSATVGTAGPRPPTFAGFEANNNAPTFNGTSGYITTGNSLLNNRGAFTIAGWIKPTTTGNRIGLFGQNDCVEFGFINSTTLECWTPGGGFIDAPYGQSLNTWHHVTVVGDGNSIRIFVDGTLIGTGGAPTGSYGTSASPFNIGGGGVFDATGNFFNGQIDEVLVYHRALTTTEIQSLYQSGLTPANASVAPFVRTDVGTAMSNVNASAYIRIPFTVDAISNVSLITLRMRYDDGFVAFINGTEVQRANAPDPLAYNSAATGSHSPLPLEEFRLGPQSLIPGLNVLAIQGLNQSAGDTDFLIAAEVAITVVTAQSSNPLYFTIPSPGAPNGSGVAVAGPAILDPHHSPSVPTDSEDIVVTASVVPTFQPVASVVLRYRVMFGNTNEVTMFDDGLHGDGGSNDMVYAATIPASASTNGQMVRWYISATDTAGAASRWPLFTAPTETEYLGTMVADPTVTSKLPIVYLFAPATVLGPGPTTGTSGADSQTGARGVSVFHDGEFYDNILMAVRGNTTATYNKKSHRLEFNADHAFRHSGPGPRLLRTSFVADYPDPTYMRQGLCYWLGDLIGCPSPFYIPHRLQLNGRFYQLANHNDVSGREMLDRLGYDSAGALYNAAGQVTPGRASTGGFEKKTREWDTTDADYAQLANAVAETVSLGQRRTNIFDMLDLPQIVSYMVVARWAHENDDVWANMSLYHDNDGDNLWRIVPFDMNLSWGAIFYEGSTPLVIEGVQATNDIHKAFPLYGSSQALPLSGPAGGYNRIYDCMFLVPEARQMFLRRLRTMLDTYVFPIGTPPGASPVEQRILFLRDLIAEEANRDRAFWGWPAKGGQCNFDPGIGITNGVNAMLSDFVIRRRQHFYGKHSVTNTALPIGITKDSNAGIPLDQSGDAVVLIAGLDYNPSSGNQEQEYVCITNPQPYAVDISDWELSGGIRFKFKKGTVIPTNSVLYVSPNVVAFRSRTVSPRGGQGLFVVGSYEGQLSARGETLLLHDQWGRLVHTNSYPGTPSAAQQFLRITEIMYSPAPPPSGPYTREDFEYIELKNTGPSVLSLLNVRFLEGVTFNFTGSAVTALNPGQSVVVVRNTNAFTARYGAGLSVAGQYVGSLDNGGERLRLVDATGEEILDFSYNNSWYPITDGYGFSLVIRDEAAPFYTWGDKASWRASGQLNGSPGTGNGTAPNIAPIRINEVLAHTDLPQVDSVELYNPTTNPVDISGWFISDDLTNIAKFRIPNGTTIAAGGYRVFDESQFNPNPGTPPSFAFSSKGDEVVLASADLGGNLTGYLDMQNFGASENGVSFGPHVISTGEEHFVPRQSVTPNAANTPPKVGPVIISEIMYRPPDVGGEDNALDEFIELKNLSGSTVNLYDPAFPTNTWRLDKGIDFDFPPGVSMPPLSLLLVVNFNPTNTVQLAAFRARYNISPSVPVYGPYEGKLDNSGERIELQKPDAPDTNGVPYVTVERVDYEDSAPWPVAADGAGASLHRRSDSSYYNDPANWAAAIATPGSGYINGTAPSITTQPVTQNVVATTDATLSVNASGPPPLYYQWRHNGSVIPGATNSSYTIDNARPPDRGDYDVIVFNGGGSTLSSNAVIEILIPARISQHPASIVFNRGSTNNATYGNTFTNFNFSVQALSSSPLTYQWRFNGTNIANGPNYFGVTGATLTVSNATLAHAGTYSVLITDAVGTIESAPATLTINVPVFITQHPQSVTAVGGDTVYFMVSTAGTPPYGYRWRRGGINMFPQYAGGFSPFPFISIAVTNVPSIQTNRFDVIVNNPGFLTPGVPSQNAFLFVLPDADGDGLPDAFETANGFDPANPADGRIDSDGDGMKNFEEYTAGTDPNDPASYLKVDTITLGLGANITFMARSNKTYSVQYRDNLTGTAWQRLTNLNATATNRVETVVDASGTTNRFYRLVVPNQP